MDNLVTLYAPSAFKQTPDLSTASPPAATLSGHSGFISSVNFCAGNKLFSTSGDGSAMLWDVDLQTASTVFKSATAQGLTCGAPQPDQPSLFVTCEVCAAACYTSHSG
jgi:WD40 repeat protein